MCVYLTFAYFSVSVPRKCDLIVTYHIPHIQLFLLYSTYLILMAVFLFTKECWLLFNVCRIF
jgi:hypothetical protein